MKNIQVGTKIRYKGQSAIIVEVIKSDGKVIGYALDDGREPNPNGDRPFICVPLNSEIEVDG